MKVWVVTEFAEMDGKKIPVGCEVFSKKKNAYAFGSRDSKAFRVVTEKIVDNMMEV